MSETAILGGGCFWCLEAVFQKVRGVSRVISGYAGGISSDPEYEEVCSGITGHAEVVHLTFNPDEVKFSQLLEIFFVIHDPTTLNRQGADVGSQYRSVIFCTSPEQETVSGEFINDLDKQKIYSSPIVTEIKKAPDFYPAEDYHQNFFNNNPHHGYCNAVVVPKVKKFLGTLRNLAK